MMYRLMLMTSLVITTYATNPLLDVRPPEYVEVNPQKILYQAIQDKNNNAVLSALSMLDAEPTFVVAIKGTRTKKQINALNYALRVYKETGESVMLQTILKKLTPKTFDDVLNYQDQIEQKTPMDLAGELFPDTAVDELLGAYIKRSSGPINVE